ncbi:unnamed protein product [Adineta ricciae]|uniref:G-protein coupled receptors family 1 profile domain-containing protein n=1 Tax=Adineta ricciae TaxID=249248 RepID=A0A813UPU9_ADIRI|nr:unnamed protein product [Adineta ricciae]
MSNSSTSPMSTMEYIQRTLTQISIPYIIIIPSIGIAGNVLTIIMLSKRSLTKNFNNCTLIALGAADLLFNLTLVSFCINKLSGLNSDSFCRFLSFCSHLAELLSACFTAHFTIQRFIAVRFPLSVFMEKNVHILHYVIESLIILFGVSYCLLLIMNNRYDNCQEQLASNWFISDALSSFVIPFLIIATLNLLIIFHLRKTSRKNQQLSSVNKRTKRDSLPLNNRKKPSISFDSQSRSSELNIALNPKHQTIYQFRTNGVSNAKYLSVSTRMRRGASIRSTTRSHAQSHRVTRMLILVSTCFLLLNAPWHICTISSQIIGYIANSASPSSSLLLNSTFYTNDETNLSFILTTPTSMSSRESPARSKISFLDVFYIVMIITQHVSYLSYSINFFLYSFCGMKFRRELMKVLSRCRNHREHLPTSTTANFL